MKINQLQINSYGKLKNQKINLKSGFNVIYGLNEAGKSTLLHFITSCFYGISKNKRGKAISDYDLFKPWEGENFSGKIDYQLDKGDKFEVYRDFLKKNPNIYNENGEDISKNYEIDKTKGNHFFQEQTQVDEELFLSTLAMHQQEVRLEKSEQNFLLQKIANLVGTGEDKVSYQKAIDRINRRQLEEIGTERSREKPINLLQREIQKLNQEKKDLQDNLENRHKQDEEKESLEEEIKSLETEISFIKDCKKQKDLQNLQNEKIQVKEEFLKQNQMKIETLKLEKQSLEVDDNSIMKTNKRELRNLLSQKKKFCILSIGILFITSIISILVWLFMKNQVFAVSMIGVLFLEIIGYFVFLQKKNNNLKEVQKELEKEKVSEDNKTNLIEQQINLLKENNQTLEDEIKQIKNEFAIQKQKQENEIRMKYQNSLSNENMDIFMNLENLAIEIEEMEKELNHLILRQKTLEMEDKNREPALEKISQIEERLAEDEEKLKNYQNLNQSMELAKEVLAKAYDKMKNSVTPKFTQNLSDTISEITKGKYQKVNFNDEVGLMVALQNGNYVSADCLSVGTIDQLYLSLRLAMIDDLSEEKLPIILDEAFAFYDTERLKNILQYLDKRLGDRQILIFTCTNREKELLEKLQIDFNLVTL